MKFSPFQNLEIQKRQNNSLVTQKQFIVFKLLVSNFKKYTQKQMHLGILFTQYQHKQNHKNYNNFSVVQEYPKKIIRCNINFYKNVINELTANQFSEQDYQHKLSKQKGQIEYFSFQLSIEEQLTSEEIQDLELIEKEFGEILIEEFPSSQQMDKMMKIIEAVSLTESIKNLTEEKLNFLKLRLELEKFDSLFLELSKIQDSSKNKTIGQIEILHYEELTSQTESVIKTLKTFECTDKEIFQILINEELRDLERKISEYKQYYQNQQGKNIEVQGVVKRRISQQILKTEKQEEVELNKQTSKQKENHQIIEKDVLPRDIDNDNFNKETYSVFLQFMIKVVKLQALLIKQERELLQKLFEEITLFSDKLDQIQKYKQEVQANLYQKFYLYFLTLIKSYEQQKWAKVKQQLKEDGKFQLQFQTILDNLPLEVNEVTQQENNIDLNDLKVQIKEKLDELGFFTNHLIDQEFLISKLRKIYLLQNEEEFDEEQNQKSGLLGELIQKYQDFDNNYIWKIKQGLVFTIIQISLNCFSDKMMQFCQNALIQLWTEEKDSRVRNLLKNADLISIQMQILSRNWQTQHDKIAEKMQQMLDKIDKLQEQISHEANLNQRDLQLKEMDETTVQLDEYIENISEMGLQLRLVTDFVNHIRKGLIRVEGKINQMKEQLKSMGNDIKFLRGKSVEQLFEIRKWKVLKEAAFKNVKSIYVPLQTQEIFHQAEEKKEVKSSILMNFEQLNDTEGEVNQFLLEQKQTVLLIHGVAGSGKSTTAKKIEEFIWKLQNNNKKISNQILIPIYISLPSLKNPVFQAVEEALRQDEYGFDELQLKECKEMLEKKDFRIFIDNGQL
ncbi:unnamed protein product (macronuclear) [Paramecium tetraurelia]|uniref:NACHT domain-containing protein n=1 Tax=Paramecium tetraurelia TaxID=5888 RepID=A0C275_PARTE|nr:uncharacterized protein GSPATT00034369001 [Paramecium tetraurelia]CAK64892.1 unnamed protein product [Paramecium tetraurelia]|eukprot:XP_001432289.1 hypothetical protein (macronuclear) [Paramecium tetraurelia strain d4-2]